MSEFLNANWLGIIAVITGIPAIFISVYNLRKEKPNLKVSVTECKHSFTPSRVVYGKKDINFRVIFHIRNVGDRGTRISDMNLSFTVDGESYNIRRPLFGANNLIDTTTRWIEAWDNTDITAQFCSEYKSAEKDQLSCTFTIYHTHNPCKIKGIVSEKKPINPIEK